MSAQSKKTQALARELFKLSLENGSISPERVGGVLEYVEKTQPANTLAVLKAYQRLVSIELSRGEAVVEHAGDINDSVLKSLAAAFSAKYRRPITTSSVANPSLIAGLRVRVGDDVYESSISGQLAALAGAV